MIKNIKKLKENNLKCYLIVVTIITIFNTSISYAYTFNNSYTFGSNNKSETKENKNVKDPYYEELIKKFKSDKKYIDKVYNKYSAYVIELSDKYGIEPIIAMSQMKSGLDFAVLATNPDLFMDLYNSLSNIKNKEKRSGSALKLANAFLLYDPNNNNWKDNFTKLVENSSRTFLEHSQNATLRLDKAKTKIKETLPINYLTELKKDRKLYTLFLSELANQKQEIIDMIIKYPNSVSFLLNTGKEGLELLKENPEPVITLSFILTLEEQEKLIKNCKKHPKLLEALKYCGIESYFTIMRCPNFYEKLVSRLNGDMFHRHILAYAYLIRQEDLKDNKYDNIKYIIDKLEDNNFELDSVAGYLSELLFYSSNEIDIDTNVLAPFYDKCNLSFIKKYGNKAVRITKKYGNLLNIATLFMEDWDGENEDIEPLFEAVDKYKDYAIQAILEFRYNRGYQETILKVCPDSRRRTDLLMFLFYDKHCNNALTKNYTNGLDVDSINGILEKYTTEEGTGMPQEGKTTFWEFIPGYDICNTLRNYFAYGESPTISSYLLSALDLVDIVPMAAAATTVISYIGTKGVKNITKYGIKNLGEKLPKLISSALEDISKDKLGKMTIKSLNNIPKELGKNKFIDLWAEATIKMPKFINLTDYYSYIKNLASACGVSIRNIIEKELKSFTGLYSRPWKVKHSVDRLIDGTIYDFVVMPAIFYTGAVSLESYLESK